MPLRRPLISDSDFLIDGGYFFLLKIQHQYRIKMEILKQRSPSYMLILKQLLTCFTIVAAVSAFAKEPPAALVPSRLHLLVPSDVAAPKMDGYVLDTEWSDAVTVVSLCDMENGMLANEEFKTYLKCDSKNLYIAFRRRVANSEQLLQNRHSRDSEVYNDDSIEIYLYPKLDQQDFYQVVFNAAGAIFDRHNDDVAWNGDWNLKQNFGAREQGGETTWTGELAIPLAAIGIDGKNENTSFGFSLFVNQKTPDKKSFGITSQTGLYAQPENSVVVKLGKRAKCIGVISLGYPLRGELLPELEFGDEPQDARICLTYADGRTVEQKLTSGLGAARFQPALSGKGAAMLSIVSPVDATPDKTLFSFSRAFAYDSVPLVLNTINTPSRQELCIKANFAAFERQGDVAKYTVEIDGHPQHFSRQSEKPQDTILVSTQGLPPGPHNVKLLLLDDQGTALLTRQIDYSKDGNEPWLNNKLGIDPGFVPPPFTPIEIQDRAVHVIGREIELSETGLPRKIISQGLDLISRPVTLSGTLNGKQEELKAVRPFAFKEIQPDDSTGDAELSFGPLKGTLRQTVSFDGFCWYEISLASPQKLVAKNVVLEIRMPKEIAVGHQISGMDLQKIGTTWEETWDLVKHDWSLPFAAHLWLGNTTAGLAWIAEDYRGWKVANENKAMEIVRDGNDVILRANIVDKEIDLTDGLKFSFGLQASPVKPMGKRLNRMMTINYVDGIVLPCMSGINGTEIFNLYEGQRSYRKTYEAYYGLAEPAWPDLCKIAAKEQNDKGVQVVPYSNMTCVSMGLDDFKAYQGDWDGGAVWTGTANITANPAPITECNTESKTLQDFIVWRFVKNWDSYGGNAVYYDLFCPPTIVSGSGNEHAFTNEQKYITRTGQTACPTLTRSTREIARRLYIAFKKKNPDFMVYANGGGGFYLPLMAFIDAALGQDTVQVTKYPEILTYDRFRNNYYGYPIGVKTFFMPHHLDIMYERKDLANYLNGLTLNHNNPMYVSYVDYATIFPYWRVYYSGDWGTQQFLPYWNYPALTNLDPEKFKVSGWYNKSTNQGLLCVASLSGEPTSARISVGDDWKFNRGKSLLDACNQTNEKESHVYPSKLGRAAFEGNYDELLKRNEIGATYVNGEGKFKPYGVLFLNVND